MASGNALAVEPSGPTAGLVVTANGKRIPWVRDRVDMYAFHVEAPKVQQRWISTSSTWPRWIRSEVDFLGSSPTYLEQRALYPAGYFSRDIKFETALRLPEGWKFACSLDVKSQNGNLVQFKDTTLNTLIDSPLYAGVNFKRLDLSTGPDNPVYLDVFADKPADLEITPEELQFHKNLVIEAQKLFNSRHYDRYDFLFSVSDIVSGKGLEHHQSSEDGSRANYFTDWGAELPVGPFCPTNTPIRGTASSAGRLTCGRPTSTCRCVTTCYGFMRA